jgi:drug/metabolite transporter (DMT)-like permease
LLKASALSGIGLFPKSVVKQIKIHLLLGAPLLLCAALCSAATYLEKKYLKNKENAEKNLYFLGAPSPFLFVAPFLLGSPLLSCTALLEKYGKIMKISKWFLPPRHGAALNQNDWNPTKTLLLFTT